MLKTGHIRGSLAALLLCAGMPASGSFDAPISHEVGGFLVSGVTIGDMDGDGLADVAAANGSVSLLVNDGTGLGPVQYLDDGPGEVRYVAIEDIDGDGDRDLVVLERGGDSLIVVLRNQGDGSYATAEPYGLPDPQSVSGNTWALRLADIDLDGDLDAVVMGGFIDPLIILLRNDGSGAFEDGGSHLLATVPFVYVADIDVADFNGDGYPDVAGVTLGTVAVLFNSGQGGLLPAAPVDLGQQTPAAVLARDVNDDGRPDLLVAGCGGTGLDDHLRVGLNDGAGGFVLSDVVPLTGACHSITNPMGLASGYLDDDTVIDLVYPSRDTDSLRLLHGVGDGTFEASEILPTDPGPVVVAVGDVNGDGSPDVISGNSPFSSGSPDTIAVFVNVVDDTDGDEIADASDNCAEAANTDQRDTDSDGIGNICDADLNGDCSVNFADLAAFKAAIFPNPYNEDADFDGDGFVNFGDLALMKSTFFNGANPGPGPSGLPNGCDGS